jgi:hypothetical protein
MNTLVIHPEDESTDFLKSIYKNIANKTVITGEIEKRELDQLIKRYQWILMLGHGSPAGLFSMDQFPNSFGYIVDDVSAMYLRGRKQTMCIWCHSDEYFFKNKLKGFYTGMFISEMDEAQQFLTDDVGQDVIDESNDRFAYIIGQNINEPLDIVYHRLVEGYGELVRTNPVVRYNYQRLYYRD